MDNSSAMQPIQLKSEQQEYQFNMKTALSRVIAKIRESLDIDSIFQITVSELRRSLKADRVGVLRFYPELGWQGEFICEDVGDGWSSPLTDKFSVHGLAEELAKIYQQGRIQVLTDIYEHGISDCQVQILEKYQVLANLAVPLLKGKELWGLLCIHQCSSSRQWETSEIEFVQLIATHLEIALQQADYIEQVKVQSAQIAQTKAQEKSVEWQKTIAIAIEKIRQSLDLETIFRASTAEIRKLIKTDRVAIYRFNPDWTGEFVFESVGEGWISLIDEQSQRPELRENVSECSAKDLAKTPVVDTYLQDTEGGRFTKGEVYRVCNDIYSAGFSDCYIKVLEAYQAKAYVIIAIYHGQKLWGLLAAYHNTEMRNWQEDEVYLLTQVSTQLGVAIQQAELFAQTQRQKEEIAQTLKELKETQSQLIHSEKMASLGQLVAGIAHEINNPISFIYGNITYINEHTNDLFKLLDTYQKNCPNLPTIIQQQIANLDLDYITDDLPKILASMTTGAERISQLVLSLRTFARLDEADMKPVNLHEGLDSTLLILQHRLQPKTNYPAIEVIKEYGNLPEIVCYAAQMNQVFMNIINNAIDAIEHKIFWNEININPQIIISTKVTEEHTIGISIADNGCGIPDNLRSRIFEPFFTTKEPGQGTGLGLSISYKIVVEKHGGKIKCISEPGKGCEFYLEIPQQPLALVS
ncbi:histidine kinase with GAF domain [Nostoc sp. PCC 7524]|uniref:GAF domain-containing protein n=1 Tax=Nostoc sp. (strain ATCC 29411 / PCC 7524) TaxID=28072 RepID=UPI00029F0EDA|nr:GAF domain-containing protein [Nostoc sp. PCC 7524]AFY49821.1 histidine kinase with GAF domain [Nostoc sp. PCC 7524]